MNGVATRSAAHGTDDDQAIPVELVFLPDGCYCCGGVTAPVIGIWLRSDVVVDGYELGMLQEADGWFLQYDDTSADLIAQACPDDLLAAHGAGPLRWRTTRMRRNGYLANTCLHCRAVLGNWPLHEKLISYRSEGGTLRRLPRAGSAISGGALGLL
jgi:hypothetical protein